MTGTQKVGKERIRLRSISPRLAFYSTFVRHGERLDVQHGRMQQCAAQGGGEEKSPCVVNGNNQEGGSNAAF